MKQILSPSNIYMPVDVSPTQAAQNDAWFQSILECSPNIIVSIDQDLSIIAFNEAFRQFIQKFYGKIPNLGDSIADLYQATNEVWANWEVILFHLKEKGKWADQERICHNGDEFFFENNVNCFKNPEGEIVGFNVFKRDITLEVLSQRKTEELTHQLAAKVKKKSLDLENMGLELESTEKKFRRIFDSSSIGIALVEPDGKVAFPNPALCELLGYTMEELKGLSFAEFTHPDDLEIDLALFEKLNNGEFPYYEIEKRYIRSDGQIVWGLLNVSLLREINGNVTYAVGIVNDITKKKCLEKSVIEKNKELEKNNSYLDNFVHATAHDLRSPIANLRQISDLIIMLNKSNEDPIHQKLSESVSRLDRTVSGLIQIIDEQKLKKNSVRKTCFTQKLEGLQHDMAEKIKSLEARIELDFQASCIVYPEPYLDSIIRNLLQNALKYSSPHRKPHIRFSTWKTKEFIVLEVKDNGIGIDLEEAGNRLFKPFKRFNNQTEGHGIGLHLVKSMVEKNDGLIEVSSKLRKGTCFTIYLKPYMLRT